MGKRLLYQRTLRVGGIGESLTMTQEKAPSTSMESESSKVVRFGKPRRSPDWIEGFQSFSDGMPSPLIFRKWAAISAIAGALQRRVYVTTSISRIYPNLYIVLVAPPTIGKSQAITPIHQIWSSLNTLHVAPDSVTRAS